MSQNRNNRMTQSQERIDRIRNLVQAEVNNYTAQTGNFHVTGDDILEVLEDVLDSEEDKALARYFAEDQILRAKPMLRT